MGRPASKSAILSLPLSLSPFVWICVLTEDGNHALRGRDKYVRNRSAPCVCYHCVDVVRATPHRAEALPALRFAGLPRTVLRARLSLSGLLSQRARKSLQCIGVSLAPACVNDSAVLSEYVTCSSTICSYYLARDVHSRRAFIFRPRNRDQHAALQSADRGLHLIRPLDSDAACCYVASSTSHTQQLGAYALGARHWRDRWTLLFSVQRLPTAALAPRETARRRLASCASGSSHPSRARSSAPSMSNECLFIRAACSLAALLREAISRHGDSHALLLHTPFAHMRFRQEPVRAATLARSGKERGYAATIAPPSACAAVHGFRLE
ncbi:hypothetical protein K438DRAFT_1956997 [Mycena galopus ATCC 62051]|nr:hypothetical protein K438DRAFT_1956997 [Mycena galopus ATCC 62051]